MLRLLYSLECVEGYSLLKNSFYARFDPEIGPKTHCMWAFSELLEPDSWSLWFQCRLFQHAG